MYLDLWNHGDAYALILSIALLMYSITWFAGLVNSEESK